MLGPTRRQREVLEVLLDFSTAHGYRPSYQQIAETLGLRSRGGICRIVRELEELGLVSRGREEGHFSISVKDHAAGSVSLNWIDQPAKETPVWASTPLVVPRFMISGYAPASMQAFYVPDRAMSPVIEQSDISLIEIRDFCRGGQIVVVKLSNGEFLIREYVKSGQDVELRAASSDFRSIHSSKEKFRIIGVHRGLLRSAA